MDFYILHKKSIYMEISNPPHFLLKIKSSKLVDLAIRENSIRRNKSGGKSDLINIKVQKVLRKIFSIIKVIFGVLE